MGHGRPVFSAHAIQRMFQRGIGAEAVLAVLETGELIAEYPNDTPVASRLLLGFVEGRPLHVVVAGGEEAESCVVVTVYEPDAAHWQPGFRKRRWS